MLSTVIGLFLNYNGRPMSLLRIGSCFKSPFFEAFATIRAGGDQQDV